MFTEITFQDYEAAGDKPDLLRESVHKYKAGREFLNAVEANAYFAGNNTEIAKKVTLQVKGQNAKGSDGKTTKSLREVKVVGNRIGSNFLFRLVAQQNQHLLSNGVTLKDVDAKQWLGIGFDTKLSMLGESALLHGVSWGFWNYDHMEGIEAAKDAESGCFALLDETTGAPGMVIQFWRIDTKRPLHLRVFFGDGIQSYIEREQKLEPDGEKKAYKTKIRQVPNGTEIEGAEGYGKLPLIPLFANREKRSEFTEAIKTKIDAYDRISSDFADNLDRANDVYWVFNNFGGTTDDIVKMMEEIQRVRAVANLTDGSGNGASAEPHTIEVPYAARKIALDLLETAIYKDYMALNLEEVTGGGLTNVAIKAAMANLNLKCDRFEWQCFEFVQQMLALIGESSLSAEDVAFKRQSLANDTETVQNIYAARGDLDTETTLKKLPFVLQEEIPGILKQREAERRTDMHAVAEALDRIERAHAASIETKVRLLHPDWADAEVAKEVDRIREENGMTGENDPPDASLGDLEIDAGGEALPPGSEELLSSKE